MELSLDKLVENIDLEKSTLRTWKRVIRNKKISNSGIGARPKLVSHLHKKKQAIESSTVPLPLPISRGGSLPPLYTL